MLMDEPFGALDPQTRWGMQGLLLDISRRLDNTTLFVTHDVSEAVYLADSIFILSPRPARLLHRLEVPFFADRDLKVKQSAQFRQMEAQILDLLHGQPGNFRIG
jgi:NitT/TauT family transport system ATP-binding protein